MIHPLHRELDQQLYAAIQQGGLSRHTGRSTIMALKYIAEALANPYKQIPLTDHYVDSSASVRMAGIVTSLIEKMGLQELRVENTYTREAPKSLNYSLIFGVVK